MRNQESVPNLCHSFYLFVGFVPSTAAKVVSDTFCNWEDVETTLWKQSKN